MFETFDHTADLGIRVRAADLDALFVEAARGLLTVIAGDLANVRPSTSFAIELATERLDDLFFDWLNELLYRFEAEKIVSCEFEVHVEDCKLTAKIRGEPWTEFERPLEHEVKAITYHGLKVEQTDNGWLAEVIVDI